MVDIEIVQEEKQRIKMKIKLKIKMNTKNNLMSFGNYTRPLKHRTVGLLPKEANKNALKNTKN